MKVKKKAVRSGILKLEKNVQITLDEDMNVPDTRPDVEKIIESRGEVHIDEIEVLTDRLRLRGSFLVQILYLSTDPEQQISCMEHDFAIEECWKDKEQLYLKTQLIGPSSGEEIIETRTCPFLVVRCERTEQLCRIES